MGSILFYFEIKLKERAETKILKLKIKNK